MIAGPTADGRRFVFVSNPKAASMSIEKALQRYRGPANELENYPRHCCLKKHLPRRYDRYSLRIAVVRNPWDRIVSGWAYRGKHTATPFERWVTQGDWTVRGFDFKTTPQVDSWLWQINYFIRFEHLVEDWEALRAEHLPEARPLSRVNASPTRTHYSHYFTPALRQHVQRVFAPDIERFGYYFEHDPTD